jgi:hypothetical protein
MRNFRNAIKGLPHAEERPQGASRSTHSLAAALPFAGLDNLLTASFAGVAGFDMSDGTSLPDESCK